MTSLAKAAQCGQVIDAYSMIVTGASALPWTMSSALSSTDWPPTWGSPESQPATKSATAAAAMKTDLHEPAPSESPGDGCGRAGQFHSISASSALARPRRRFEPLQRLRKRGRAGRLRPGSPCAGSGMVRKPLSALQFARNEPHPRDPAGPEIGRQPLQQLPGLVLEEDRRARLALQREHAALRALGQLQRFGDARDVRARDLAPAQHEGCVREAGALECRRSRGRAHPRRRDRRDPAAPCPDLRPARFVCWFASSDQAAMTRKSPHHKGTEDEEGEHGRASARLVRHASPRPAVARQARRDRRSLSRLALRDHAPADDGHGGRAVLPRVPEALAGRRRASPLRIWMKSAAYGPGSATTPARAISTARRRRSCATTADVFRATRPSLRALPGIGAYTAGAIAAIAFGEPVAAMDGNAERVVARLSRRRRRTAEGQSQARRARSGARARRRGPAISRKR